MTQETYTTNERELGRLEGRLGSLETRHRDLEQRIEKELGEIRNTLDKETGEIKTTLTDTQESVESIHDILKQVKGAWKLACWIGGALAILGSFVAWATGIFV